MKPNVDKSETLHIHLLGPDSGPIPVSFETAGERLSSIERLHFELDGSFVWRDEVAQQVDGMLYDAGGQLRYVDLHVRCNVDAWHRIADAIAGASLDRCLVLRLPSQVLQKLQAFEASLIAADAG